MSKTKTRKITSESFSREAIFDARELDGENRTVSIAFSSESPVERWFGLEILDHASSSVRLGRLNNGAPVLVDHNSRDQVGVIESAAIDDDRIGRAVVRFGKSERATEIFNDVKDGIRTKISVGYRIHKMTLEDPSAEDERYRATDWEPHEVSIVSIPADDDVGVGRSDDKSKNEILIKYKDRQMPEDNEGTTVDVAVDTVDANAERELATTNERKRTADILAAAGDNQRELAQTFIEQGRSAEDFKHVVQAIGNQAGAVRDQTSVAALGLTAEETQRFSLMTAIRASVSGDWKHAGFERECSIAIADKLGREARGFFVPHEVQSRTMDATSGAAVIGTDHLAGSFIDNLRAQSVVGAAGATILSGLTGNVDIPKKTGSAAFGWLDDDDDASLTDAALGSIAMSPKTIAGGVAMSRRLLKQSSPAIEQMIQSDLALGAALAIDIAALQGSGAANQPRGVVNVAGVNTQAVADAGGVPTWAELVGFETAVASDEALQGALRYITTSAVRGGMKVAAKDAGSGLFLLDGGVANGYPLSVSNQLTAKRIIFGNFADVLIGMWGVLDLMPDTAAKAASGGLVLRAFQDIDIAVRHAESFCINS